MIYIVAKPSDLSVRWTKTAQGAFFKTLLRIASEDFSTAELVLRRVEKTLAILVLQPGIGTQTAKPGLRQYAIPQTGHSIQYRVVGSALVIHRWYRQRQLGA